MRGRKSSREFRAEVDAFLAAPKTLAGSAAWQPGNRAEEWRATWPVLVSGKSANATLQLTAYPNEPERRFTIGLHWPFCVWRLDFEPIYKKHTNPLADVSKSGLEPKIVGPHYHAWADNRHLMKLGSKELLCARPFKQTMTWPASLRWFCGETNIKMSKEQMLDFPRKDRLL